MANGGNAIILTQNPNQPPPSYDGQKQPMEAGPYP